MSLNFPSKKNAPFRGKFQGRLIMREIGLVADDMDFGAIVEGVVMHIAVLRDAHFGETGATIESTYSNLRGPFGDYTHAVFNFVFCHIMKLL